ncbi:hypothetical protein A2Y85_05230 [candidate division WOR-3 bacterium RBG_13_43_14]|uniref:SPOR domain-containing protein n=1 Tax=candidate division WOR-3 bacterium RBG_13_43_14 TaxID=1802590 RepID=A0A1F4UEF9_UNCW3|nr:MAG: hypothetical protein A2Y85_05230 [candidate division WOR-3 bacterium RBG_13_43_14]
MIFGIKPLYLAVLSTLIYSLIISCNSSIFIGDSTIYQLDRLKTALYSRPINTPIDYVVDDYLYVLTRRQLIKINANTLKFADHLPLPYQFSYLLITPLYLGLVTSNEIVLVERKNLSYTASVGMEAGDYKPLIKDYVSLNLPGNRIIICRDRGNKSILLSIDAQTGEIKRKTTVNRITASYYSKTEKNFYFFDISKHLQIYDQDLRKKTSKNTGIVVSKTSPDPSGLIIEGNEYLSLMNYDGKIFDYQPVPSSSKTNINIMALIHDKRIILIDALTIRPMNISFNACWRDIIYINDPDFFIAIDTLQMFYLISIPTLETRPLPLKKPVPYISEPPVAVEPAVLWYIQVGAFASRDNAERLQQSLQQRDLPAMVEENDMFRVKIGGFTDKETARYFIEAANTTGWLVLQPKIKSTENIGFSLNSENYRFNDGIITKEQP